MLPFDEIDELTAPAQREAFGAQNDITATIAEMVSLYLYYASTGDYRSAFVVEQEFEQYYNQRMEQFLTRAPDIVADTVMDYAKQSYGVKSDRIGVPFEQNATVYATAVKNTQNARAIIETIAPGNTGITERLPTGRTRFTPTQDFFRRELNNGIANIVSGEKTYQEVIRDIVKKMSASGIRTMTSPNRTERIDVITRRAIMTGIKDTITENAYEMGRQMGTTFFAISLHEGARPTHWWGGYRFTIITTSVIDLQTGRPFVTDEYLMQKSGGWLSDWNCRHYVVPIDANETPLYTVREIQEHQTREAERTEYRGKKYTLYEATQRMRALEREMRATRAKGMLHKAAYKQLRERATAGELEALQNPYTEARIRYRLLRAEYTKFAEAFNIRPQFERVTYDMLGRVF